MICDWRYYLCDLTSVAGNYQLMKSRPHIRRKESQDKQTSFPTTSSKALLSIVIGINVIILFLSFSFIFPYLKFLTSWTDGLWLKRYPIWYGRKEELLDFWSRFFINGREVLIAAQGTKMHTDYMGCGACILTISHQYCGAVPGKRQWRDDPQWMYMLVRILASWRANEVSKL